VPAGPGRPSVIGVPAVPPWRAGLEVSVLPEAYRDLLEVVADAGRPVAVKALAVLAGASARVAAEITAEADTAGLTAAQRTGADACVRYLAGKQELLRYDQALAAGWPIATGVIERACRHWGLDGAEAVLTLRAVISNGDFSEYWRFHLDREHQRLYPGTKQVQYTLGGPTCALTRNDADEQRGSRAFSRGAQDTEATGLPGIASCDLDGRPGPLPDADARYPGEPDLPASTFDCNARPGTCDARPVPAVRTQHPGEDHDRVVALERDEGGRFAEPFTQGCPDSRTQRAEALGQVAQERDRDIVLAQQRRPRGELRLPGRGTDHDPGEALVAADRPDDRHCRLRVADQEKDGCHAAAGELVAQGRGGERTHVELDDGAATWREVVPEDAGP